MKIGTPETNSQEGLRALLSKLECYAAQKDPRVLHTKHSDVRIITHKISRAVMRYPNAEVLQQLHMLHVIIRNTFADMPDGSIMWLLGGAPLARGGFKDAHSFNVFFNTDPTMVSPSRLMTALDSVITAVTDRRIQVTFAEKPIVPQESHPGFIMYQKLQAMFSEDKIVPFLGDAAYTARPQDTVSYEQACICEDRVEALPDYVSDVSDAENEEAKRPQRHVEGKVFRKKLDPARPELSWPAAAQSGNVPIRAHVSGTVPAVLSVVQELFRIHANFWMERDENVRKLSGAWLLPTYERGDFHTIAETAAGVEYYLEARQKDKKDFRTLLPQEALLSALEHMVLGSERVLQGILNEMIPLVIGKTKAIPVRTQLNFDDFLEIIHNGTDIVLVKAAINSVFNEVLWISEKTKKLHQILSALNTSSILKSIAGVVSFLSTIKTIPSDVDSLKHIKRTLLRALPVAVNRYRFTSPQEAKYDQTTSQLAI